MLSILPAFILALAATLPVRAQNLTEFAQQVANEVGRKAGQLSPAQQQRVWRELEGVRRLLDSAPNEGTPPPRGAYQCVSRDNDGRDPWQIGFRDFTNTVRIPGTVLGARQSCETALANARSVYDRLFVCASRDDDGRNPFKVMALNGTAEAVKLPSSALENLEDCVSVTRTMRVLREGVIFCGSRDDDGRRPFLQVGYRFDGSVSRGNESYNSLADCQRAL